MFNFLKLMFSKDAILYLILCSQERLYLITPQILCLTVIDHWQFSRQCLHLLSRKQLKGGSIYIDPGYWGLSCHGDDMIAHRSSHQGSQEAERKGYTGRG